MIFSKTHILNLLQSKGKKYFIRFACFFVILFFFIGCTSLSNILARSLTVTDETEQSEIVFVLGGGAYKNGELSASSSRRFLRGVSLYQRGLAGKIAFIGGTITDRSRKIANTAVSSAEFEDSSIIDANESLIMKRYFIDFYMNEDDLIVDETSTHTYTNMISLMAVMDYYSFKSCIIVSSPTHMKRISMINDKLEIGCKMSPVNDYTGEIKSVLGRVNLFMTVLWEYAGITFYKMKGYI